MKKIIRNISLMISILVLLIILDVISIYKYKKPIFILKEDNNIYYGVFYDVYNCDGKIEIKFKNNKYSCKSKIDDNNKNKESRIKVTLVGDLLFEGLFYKAVDNGYDKEIYFSEVKDYFKNDDLSIGNMEVVIGNEFMTYSGDGYNFCAPPYVGDLVSSLDFEVLSTANNHAFDRGIEGINSTIDYFKNNSDIVTFGTKKDISNNIDNILNINNINVGILSYTYGTNKVPDKELVDLISYYKDPYTKEINKDKIKEDIDNIKSNSDIIIVLIHWGKEFEYNPNDEQKELALYLNELGVDIIVGSHSHNVSPIEVIGDTDKTLVYYSMGNFVSHDDDIARTKKGNEEFDNAYQVGLLSTLDIVKDNNKVYFDNINNELIVNYFDTNLTNFKLIPYSKYTSDYEISHYRYNYGLNKEFISKLNNIIKIK